ncbi:MAG: histidine kinase dimerization/phospho-acceptor domain-containing protein [Pseudomonadota bacterium]
MWFDDRLATVLSQPVSSPHDRAVRWRQLVDLVARADQQADRELLDKALDVIRNDQNAIRASLRAAAARSIAGSPIPLALLTVFAQDTLAIAAPLIASASLSGEALDHLRAAASPDVRRFLDSLSKSAAQAGVSQPESAPEPPPAAKPVADAIPSITEVVARIEQLRLIREVPTPARPPTPTPIPSPSAPLPPPAASPLLPPYRPTFRAEQPSRAPEFPVPALFRWECGAGGDIEWVEGAPRGPLIGRSIALTDTEWEVDDCLAQAFAIRAPFRDCLLNLGTDGLLAGEWQISGVPAFASNDGRFMGYRGIASRAMPEPEPLAPRSESGLSLGHDALREMIHEIKTPLNAIIGFAEIIGGQYFGPAHSRYRERAAEIVSNAGSLLEAAEDLDFVARLQSAREAVGDGTNFASFFPVFADGLVAKAAARSIELLIDAPEPAVTSKLDPELSDRLLRRFTEAILAASAANEQLTLRLRRFDDRIAISLTRPRATIMAGKQQLLDPEFTIGGTDRALLGLGFSMRLINGLVGIAGGALDIDDAQFTLSVPRRT